MEQNTLRQYIKRTVSNLLSEGTENNSLAEKCNELGIDINHLEFDESGFSPVCAKMKKYQWNWIDRQGNILSNQWFNYAGHFYTDDVARVKMGKMCNWVNKQGALISKQWFDDYSSGDFYGRNFARVYLKGGKNNFINKQGNLISPNQWFEDIRYTNIGLIRIRLNGKYSYINEQGEPISRQWFDYASLKFNQKGVAIVVLNGEKYYFFKDGSLYDYKKKEPINATETKHRKKTIRLTEAELKQLVSKVASRIVK